MPKEGLMKTKSSITDRILKPKVITLSDHTVVQEERSDAALLFLLTLAAFFLSLKITGFNLNTLVSRGDQIFKIFSIILNPKPGVLISILPAIFETLSMSVIGTLIGVLLAMPMAAVSSYNVNPNAALVSILRFLLSLLRSFPIIIVATICTLIFSLGSLSGTIAISVFTFSTVTKMLIESIETMDMRAFEALQSMGANRFRAFWSACIPEILSTYISHALYSFEINVRTAAILGYVGAGGIGILIGEKVAWRDYRALGTIVITLFVIVIALNIASRHFRKKYQGRNS